MFYRSEDVAVTSPPLIGWTRYKGVSGFAPLKVVQKREFQQVMFCYVELRKKVAPVEIPVLYNC